MKNFIKWQSCGLGLLIALFAVNLSAQGPGGPGRGFQMSEEDIKERAETTATTLGLNEDQHKKILAIDMDFYNKMQIQRQKMMSAGGSPSEADRTAMRENMMKMRDDRNAQYKEVLTSEQYEKFLEIQEQRRNEMRQQRQQNPQDEEEGERPARGRGRG